MLIRVGNEPRSPSGLILPPGVGDGPRDRGFMPVLSSRRRQRGLIVPGAGGGGGLGVGEPGYDGGVAQTLILNDGFDSYTTPADLITAGYRFIDDTTIQDTQSNAAGSNLLVTGRTGSGKGTRIQWYGNPNNGAGLQEQHALSWAHFPDNLAGKPGHALYLSFWVRFTGDTITPILIDDGFATLSHSNHILQIKFVELWRSDLADRAQFSISNSFSTNGVPYGGTNDGSGSLWNAFATAGGTGGAQAGQVSPPFIYQYQGQWKRVTMKYMTQTAPGARDGIMQLWYDGTLVLSVRAADVGVAPPNRLSGTQPYCTTADLDAFSTNDYVPKITWGSVMSNGTLWRFSMDMDEVSAWRD